MIRIKAILGSFLLFGSYWVSAQGVISPKSYGLDNAKTDIERYWVLYNTHVAAVNETASVSYKGIDTIRMEIPQNAHQIPLSYETDFSNAVIIVRNNSKQLVLFSMNNMLTSYGSNYKKIEKREKIGGKGQYIVVLEDETPWVRKREGFDYGHLRKDIVFIDNGRVEGEVVSTYGNSISKPTFARAPVDSAPKSFKNLVFIRDSTCSFKTYLLSIDNQYNVKISNIAIKTPPSPLYGDAAIRMENCYKVMIQNTTIEGTYSQVDKYGYGISLNNVSDVEIDGLTGYAKWGIFGNNNVNNARLKHCDINRFDVHCYGKDIFFEKCTFRNLYNQFSSMFGVVSFEQCTFYDFTPVLFESSYNAFTKFNLIFKDCTIYPSKNRCSLIYGGKLNGEKTNGRKEIEQQEYPNLYIDGLKVIMPSNVGKFYIYNFKRRLIQWPKDEIPGMVKIKGLEFVPENEFAVSNKSNLIIIPESKWTPLIYVGGVAIAYAVYRYIIRRRNSA